MTTLIAGECYQHINVYSFRDAFRDYGRLDNFSYQGLAILYELVSDYYDSCGEPWQLDVIELCRDYNEYSASELREEYSISDDISTEEYLNDNAGLWQYDSKNDCYIIQSF